MNTNHEKQVTGSDNQSDKTEQKDLNDSKP
jgi:hypothetical protein